jgi:NitT/TauT family transport system substrate-binding protein
MKKISLFLVLILILLSGCSEKNSSVSEDPADTDEDPIQVTIAGLKGPTSIGMVKMFHEEALNSKNYSVDYIAESAPDSLTGKIISGEIQISSLPINLASILYNKTGGEIQIMGINTIGNLYIVGTDEITSIDDLEGKTLGMSAKGSTPDYAMNYILEQNSLDGKVDLDYALDHATLAQTVTAEDTKIALLPQPYATQVTMNNPNVKILLDLNEEWKTATQGSSQLYTGCIVVNKEFAQNNKEFVTEFLKQYEDSVNWVLENQSEAAKLVEEQGIMPSAALVEKALPYCGITYKSAVEEKENINSFYKILFDSNPASIGGVLPDDSFYYSE